MMKLYGEVHCRMVIKEWNGMENIENVCRDNWGEKKLEIRNRNFSPFKAHCKMQILFSAHQTLLEEGIFFSIYGQQILLSTLCFLSFFSIYSVK